MLPEVNWVKKAQIGLKKALLAKCQIKNPIFKVKKILTQKSVTAFASK